MLRAARTLRAPAFLLLMACALACGGSGEPARGEGEARFLGEEKGGPPTAEVLVDSLEDRGIAVKAIGISNPVWFSPKGLYFAMAGDNVQIFEYEDPAEARADIARVAGSGDSVAGSTVPGKGPTRFYRRGRLIVLVQGDSDRLEEQLERLLGEPVAGPTAAGE
ncbi:MAG: hypothetical protein R3326_09925 [Gemmatimonadota bacterium]|nr:hypothetical protein [Gemmatimonadota bacterium]